MLDSIESSGAAPFRPMVKKPQKPNPKGDLVEEVPGQADRLRRLRAAIGYETATGFAVFLDIGIQRYNNFENGTPLSREIAFRLVQKVPGLTLDWLYFGKADGLPIELARRLGVFDGPGKRNTA